MNVADILERAADRLSEPGVWGVSCCAALAICNNLDPSHEADHELRKEAGGFFANFISGNRTSDIWRWNDAPERTQAEVVSKLREAASEARAAQVDTHAKRGDPLGAPSPMGSAVDGEASDAPKGGV